MARAQPKKELSPAQRDSLLSVLKKRFAENPGRHRGVDWAKVEARLEAQPEKLWSISEMERTSGEPDVIGQDKKTGEFTFVDCSKDSPKGRAGFCYDRAALDSRKEHKPKNNIVDAAAEMGVSILNEDQYRELQTLGEFDTTTSSWIKTPDDIRELGGALFCDRRFGKVFVYHNGAQSYYSARGFRAIVKI